MANRMKEDEKNEKIIRGLLKLPENRRCINCSSLGPQYVCTNFWTFICTTCSGVHREFTHRVKSVSMAKFTSQEVIALQEGGNERAKEIYLKEWDSQRYSAPDSSNVERLRDFIRHVYVDRRYVGERSIDKPSRVKMGDKKDSYKYRGGSGSPSYVDTYEHRYGERSAPVVADRRQDNRSGNVRSEDKRFPDGEPKTEGRPQNHQKELGLFSPTLVRPIRDILGDNIQPLRVGEPPKQMVPGLPMVLHRHRGLSLLVAWDLLMGTQWNLKWLIQSQKNVSQAPSNANTVYSLISQLSVPAAAPVINMSMLADNSGVFAARVDNTLTPSVGGNPAIARVNSMPILPSVGRSPAPAAVLAGTTSVLPVGSGDTVTRADDVGHWPNLQHPQHSSTVQQITQSIGGTLNNQGSLSTPTLQSSKPLPELSDDFSSGAKSKPTTFEPKSSGMKELPEDLFAYSLAPSTSSRVASSSIPWHGICYSIPEVFLKLSKTTNPFDLNHESALVQASSFPSMGSLQGALPNMSTPTGLLRTYSLGTPPAQWGPPHTPSYTSVMPPLPLSNASAMRPLPSSYSSGAYMGQQIPSNLPSLGYQSVGDFGSDGTAFGTLNSNQQLGGRFSAPATPSSSVGGNPFG
ncbi:hypothetical protein F0562_022984 [Nyssa sinensis]|uniref:Arf-GAP domain-containing protein n=1 Tax=Nyssa sinensis TaxID=561372 RepID=A0A5J5BJA3_9ASTE|nr:hypothetical protein F0562_022984 [Nyssa sinensis]